ncbi:hypothetical protein SISNIDRAFT_320590 [Sistotremastrum niveocremeum HHB9708]|uniref:Uncharacterized protein n=1 Tax=Sistotremastrum niveocremeum HHB9708 TaxID=1314777 RepID=A0A164MZD8_9AGAM|nr:hypothetical protein SISNIDRAFT_320590 [Sistotremastrum niveocremeum HHB9708]
MSILSLVPEFIYFCCRNIFSFPFSFVPWLLGWRNMASAGRNVCLRSCFEIQSLSVDNTGMENLRPGACLRDFSGIFSRAGASQFRTACGAAGDD